MRIIKTYVIIAAVIGFGWVLVAPSVAAAEVIITEIAWMGDNRSPNYEWLELQNIGASRVTIDGWQLNAEDGSPSITLSGAIEPGDFYIIERTSNESMPSVVADQLYTGALGNSGEHLSLVDAGGEVRARYEFSDGWPAGDNSSKETMQFDGSAWITYHPSPRASTLTVAMQNASNQEPPEAEQEDPITVAASDTASGESNAARPAVLDIDGGIQAPEHLLTGQVFTLRPHLSNNNQPLAYGEVVVNYGNGQYVRSSLGEPLHHRYEEPGTYRIQYELRAQPWSQDPSKAGEHMVMIHPPVFKITETEAALIVSTDISFDLDVSGWSLGSSAGGPGFTFPPMSTLTNKAPLRISKVALATQNSASDFDHITDHHGVAYPLQSEHANAASKVATVPESKGATSFIAPPTHRKIITPPQVGPEPNTDVSEPLVSGSLQASARQAMERPTGQVSQTNTLMSLVLITLGGVGLFGLLVHLYSKLRSENSDPELSLFQE